jgi:hypothetical protein
MEQLRKFWMGRTPKDDSEKITRICIPSCPFVSHFVHKWKSLEVTAAPLHVVLMCVAVCEAHSHNQL